MNWKTFLKRYNGWLCFAVGTLLFFAAPSMYHLIDPTAGQYDAGYIHPIIYALTVISFASGFAWLLLQLMAPGQFKTIDAWFESEYSTIPDNIRWLIKIYLVLVVCIVITICSMI